MNGREIIQRAVHFERPERMPVMFESFGMDDTAWASSNQTGSGDRASEMSYDEWGCGWMRTEVANMGQVNVHPLESRANLAGYRYPDPDDPAFYAGVERTLEGREGAYALTSVFMLLFERMHSLRGLENVLVDLYSEAAIVRDGYDSFFAGQARTVPVEKTVCRTPGMGGLVEFFEGMESHGIHEALYAFYDDPHGNQVMNGFHMPALDFSSPAELARAKLDLAIHATLPLIPLYRFPEHAGLARVKAREHVETFPFLMMWDSGPHHGFTTGTPYIEQNTEGCPVSASAEAQLEDPESFLSWFRAIMRLRRASPALQCRDPVKDSYARVPSDDERNCYAYLRRCTRTGQCMLVVANLLPEPGAYTVEPSRSAVVAGMLGGRRALRLRLGVLREEPSVLPDGGVRAELEAYGCAVLEVVP